MSTSIGDGGRTRVVIADDHALLRAGLSRLLVRQPDVEVVGEASDGRQTIAEVARTRPDLLLLDLWMPSTDPLAVINKVRESNPEIRVLILTGTVDPNEVKPALAAGAVGVVLKSSGLETLVEAVMRVRAGHRYMDPNLALEAPARAGTLSAREHEILIKLASGASYRAVAELLHLSERTVETYRRRIAEKLGLRTRAELTDYALQQGLLAHIS